MTPDGHPEDEEPGQRKQDSVPTGECGEGENPVPDPWQTAGRIKAPVEIRAWDSRLPATFHCLFPAVSPISFLHLNDLIFITRKILFLIDAPNDDALTYSHRPPPVADAR